MWPPQSVNTWLTPASLSVRATSSPPVILAEGATPSESPWRSLQTRLAARVAEPPRPPLGSHNRDFQTRLAARVAEPPRPPLGSHNHDFQTRLAARVADPGPDCLGEAARPVPCRAPGARHHRMVDEAGIPACERAELRVVREPARVTRPVGEGRGASEAGRVELGQDRADRHDADLFG